MAGTGLRIYPNSGGSILLDSRPPEGQPNYGEVYRMDPQDLSGVPFGDSVTWTFRRWLYNRLLSQNIGMLSDSIFTTAVNQKRLLDGRVFLYPASYPCQMCRVCWDVLDKRTDNLIQETATGLMVVTSAEIALFSETWQMTLFIGDAMVNAQGELEESTRGCGGGSSGGSGGGSGSGGGGVSS